MNEAMLAYAQVLLYAIPFLYGLVLVDALYGWKKGTKAFRSFDTISSFGAGITNTLKTVLGLTFFLVSYDFLLEYLAVYEIENTLAVYLIAFLALDFATYWSHRLSHEVNFFWNKHLVHHASEEYNLAVALRQPFSEFVSLFFLFMFPAAIVGVPAEAVAVLFPVHFLLQVWIHTPHIGKLGILEYLIVTPSQHRVHHALNDIYLDKNLSGVLCIWDRIFGTFQEELDDEAPVYGSKRPLRTWNPIKHNFTHLWLMIKDAWRCKSYWDKLRIWFMPTGWRPADIAQKFPLVSVDKDNLEKYDTDISTPLRLYAWFQCVTVNLMLIHFLYFFEEIGFPLLFVYGAFIFLSIYAHTSLMDLEKASIWVEGVRALIGIGLLIYLGTWFGMDGINSLLAFYFLFSFLFSFLLLRYDIPARTALKSSLQMKANKITLDLPTQRI
ncbi:MAG: sterol desaturase family protein [Bacteroidota bacterium]